MTLTGIPKNAKKYGAQRTVPAGDPYPAERLEWTESRTLSDLVQTVHRAGYVGLSWPVIDRVRMIWTQRRGLEELAADDPREPTEWMVRVHVLAVPKAAQ